MTAIQTMLPAAEAPCASAITIIAFGTPGPQGSKSFKGTRATKSGGRAPILVESSKKVKPWREAVAEAATEALYRLPPAQRLAFPLAGPLQAEMVFTLKPPARIPVERYVGGVPYPAAYPDTSKLVRSTEDALTGLLWGDDAQVVRYTLVEKLYLGTPGALEWTGATVRVWPIGGPQ
jgi:Holliday junction resolvase RusA-like endonuclease